MRITSPVLQVLQDEPRRCEPQPDPRNSRKSVFLNAQTGSVDHVRQHFERKSSEPNVLWRQAKVIDYSNTPSPQVTRMKMRSSSPTQRPGSTSLLCGSSYFGSRNRSPSPVKTGKVDRVRWRLEGNSSLTTLPRETFARRNGRSSERSTLRDDTFSSRSKSVSSPKPPPRRRRHSGNSCAKGRPTSERYLHQQPLPMGPFCMSARFKSAEALNKDGRSGFSMRKSLSSLVDNHYGDYRMKAPAMVSSFIKNAT